MPSTDDKSPPAGLRRSGRTTKTPKHLIAESLPEEHSSKKKMVNKKSTKRKVNPKKKGATKRKALSPATTVAKKNTSKMNEIHANETNADVLNDVVFATSNNQDLDEELPAKSFLEGINVEGECFVAYD